MVGRDRELRVVKEVFHRTQETRLPSLLLVSAGPGLGKTRLGWEFSKYIDGLTDDVRWLEGRCPAYGDGAPFHALAEAFRGRLRALDVTSGAGIEELLDPFLSTWEPDPGQRPWLRARMASLLGLAGASTHPREELFAAWLTVLQRMAVGASAVVLLIDDAQYADDGLLDFIEFILSARELPLLIVLLTRPELLLERPALVTNPRTVTTHLQELAPAEMARIVSALVSGMPDTVTAALVDRAAGVPLFAVETARSLIDSGVVVEHDGAYILKDRAWSVEDLVAPASLQALIASRLDALPPALREVVDLASVLGASFTTDLLTRLVDGGASVSREGVEDRLTALVQRQVLAVDANPLSGEYGAYTFTQDILRQVAYSMLSRRDRQAAHLRVVDLLDPDATDSDLPMVAHHLAAAVDAYPAAEGSDLLRERAIEALRSAGDWAMRLGSWGDADAQFQRALDLTEDPGRRAELLCRIAEVHSFGADPQRGVTVGKAAIGLARNTGDEILEGKAAGITGYLLYTLGDIGEAISLIEPYWEAFRDRTDADDALRWIARATGAARAEFGGDTSDPAEALLDVGERSGNATDLLRGLNAIALEYSDRQRPGAARLIYAGALQHAREHDQRRMEAILLANLGRLELEVDLGVGAATTRDALSLMRELHWLQGIRIGVTNLVGALHSLGQWQELDELLAGEGTALEAPGISNTASYMILIALARGQAPDPISITDLPDHPGLRASSRLANAAIRAARGDTSGLSAEVLAITRDLPKDPGFQSDFSDWLNQAGEVLAAIEATDALAEVLTEHSTIPDHAAPPNIRAARARHGAHLSRLRNGPSGEVADGLRTAADVFTACGAVLYARRTQHELSDVLADLGEVDEAAALRIPVREFYEEVGASAWLTQLDEAISSSRGVPAG